MEVKKNMEETNELAEKIKKECKGQKGKKLKSCARRILKKVRDEE